MGHSGWCGHFLTIPFEGYPQRTRAVSALEEHEVLTDVILATWALQHIMT